MPKSEFPKVSNPLSVSNLYGKGVRFNIGNEEGVSFSSYVVNDASDTIDVKHEAREAAEYYARVRMANKEAHIPAVITFTLSEQTYPILHGKLGVPRRITVGKSELIQVEPLNNFDELKHHEGEIVIQAGTLTPEQLMQLNIEVGTASIGKERQSVSLDEALSSTAEFTYQPYEMPSILGEGKRQQVGENGNLLK